MPPKTVTRFPSGVITAPPSKSLSHRAVICAALAGGRSVIENLGSSLDIQATVGCMTALGAGFSFVNGRAAVQGTVSPECDGQTLDCGESGSTLRFLLPIAALSGRPTRFTGQGRLMERPMGPYLDTFVAHGASLVAEGGGLAVQGPLTAGTYVLPGDVSSQFVSGLLFALPLLGADSEIVVQSRLESASYVDLTLSCLRDFGIELGNEDYTRFTVRGGQRYQAREYRVEGDYSQAAFFLVAAALGARLEVRGLRSDSLQGDRKILELIENAGATLSTTPEGGVVVVPPPVLRAQRVDVSDIPDLLPPLAVLMAVSEGVSEITNAARLRLKECDRLAAVTRELNALGAKVSERESALRITGVPELSGGSVRAWGDHRIAMMAAVAAIRCLGPVRIDDPDCVAKSYPGFWKDFEGGSV